MSARPPRPPREPVRCPECGMRFIGVARTPDHCPGCGHDFSADWLPGAKDPNHPGPGPWPPPFTPDPPPTPPAASDPLPPGLFATVSRRWPWVLVALPLGTGLWTGGFLTGYVLGVGRARAAVQALLRTPAYQGAHVPLPSLVGGLAGWWALTLLSLAGMVWMRFRAPVPVQRVAATFLRAAGAAAVWEVMFHIGAALAA